LPSTPFSSGSRVPEWNRRGEWPARWISCEDYDEAPVVAAYKL
jgi:hypothetical protein